MFSRKIRHVAIRIGSIRWISIRFDARIKLVQQECTHSTLPSIVLESIGRLVVFCPIGNHVSRKPCFLETMFLGNHVSRKPCF